jgi:hypothetical protein
MFALLCFVLAVLALPFKSKSKAKTVQRIRSMADLYGRWRAASGGFPTMLGARIVPLGHQIYAARRVLFDRTPRFILADEVGLGKTIEAGLIIQALQAESNDFRVVSSENLIRWIRSRKENRLMIETDGDPLQTIARIYVGLLSFA